MSNARILEVAKEKGALLFGEFRLSAGGVSGYYFDGRVLTLDPLGGYLVGKALLPIVEGCGAQAVAGPTLGADPIVSAVSVLSHIQGARPIPGLIVRAEAKEYGGKRAIEGPVDSLPPGAPVAVVDDTCTTGGNMFRAIAAVEEAGYRVAKVVCVLDRNEGGGEAIRRAGYAFHALLTADAEGRIVPA